MLQDLLTDFNTAKSHSNLMSKGSSEAKCEVNTIVVKI
jgi:hypothetical protein